MKEQLRRPSRVGLESPMGVTLKMLGVLGREMNGFLPDPPLRVRAEGSLGRGHGGGGGHDQFKLNFI